MLAGSSPGPTTKNSPGGTTNPSPGDPPVFPGCRKQKTRAILAQMSANDRQRANRAKKQEKTRANLAQIACSKQGEVYREEREEKTPGNRQEEPVNGITESKPRKTGNPVKGLAENQKTRKTLPKTLAKTPMRLLPHRARARVWKPIVLETMRRFPNFTVAAQAAGIHPWTIKYHRDKDPKFAEQLQQAIDQGADVIEAECTRRAVQGWTEPIYGRDKDGNPVKVGEKQLFDSRLAELILKRWKPEYNPKVQQEISGPNGSALPTVVAPTVIFNIPDNHRGLQQPPVDIESQKQIADIEKPSSDAQTGQS